jgi:hypothetical protein
MTNLDVRMVQLKIGQHGKVIEKIRDQYSGRKVMCEARLYASHQIGLSRALAYVVQNS